MNIFLEGPSWAGMWSEIVRDSLQNLGHRVFLYYHNRKPWSYKFGAGAYLTIFRHGSRERKVHFASYSNRLVIQLMQEGSFDLFLSIQGKIDSMTIRLMRRIRPGIRILYWLGDVLSLGGGIEKLGDIVPETDYTMLSYRGDFEAMKRRFPDRILYFPFGVSSSFHRVRSVTENERKRFSSDVSFVGTCYPGREETLRYLRDHSSHQVSVWGRSWRQRKGVRSRGRLSLEDAQKVHALSKISLNIHHAATNNGFNMKFYEIPAAGGFELCDWQEEIEDQGYSGLVATYRSREEMKDKADYFIRNPDARTAMSNRFREHVLSRCCYEKKFSDLLASL